MSNLTNSQVVNAQNGCGRLTFTAENASTGEFAIFSIITDIPDNGFSFDISDLKARSPEKGFYHLCNGEIGGKTKGNKIAEAKPLDMVFGDEYNFLQAVDIDICRNLYLAVAMGHPFDYDGARWFPLGTNGARNIDNVFSDAGEQKYLFINEGRLFEPDVYTSAGNRITSENTFVTAIGKNNTTVCEIKYKRSDTKLSGHRFVYVLNNSAEFQEGGGAGGDYNKYSISAERESDARYIDKYMIQGLTLPETPDTSGSDSIYRVNAEIVIDISGGGTPTVAGTIGQVAVVVDSDDNTVEIYKYGTTWIDVPVTSTLGEGCLVYSQSFDTALDGATATVGAGYVAIKTAGTTGNAVAIVNNIGTPASGSAFVKCYDWSFTDEDFVQYSGTAE